MIYLDYAATNPFAKYPCSKYGQFLNPNANYAYKEQKLLDNCANRVKAAIGAKSGKVVFGDYWVYDIMPIIVDECEAIKLLVCIDRPDGEWQEV